MSASESFNAILKKAQELGASDVHVCAGGPFRIRLRGQMMPVAGLPPLTPDDTKSMLERARGILVSELSFAIDVSEEDALEKLNAGLQ